MPFCQCDPIININTAAITTMHEQVSGMTEKAAPGTRTEAFIETVEDKVG